MSPDIGDHAASAVMAQLRLVALMWDAQVELLISGERLREEPDFPRPDLSCSRALGDVLNRFDPSTDGS